VAQAFTLQQPRLVRRLMLLGTGPRGGVPMHVTTASTQEVGSVNRRAEKDRWRASWL
jgi:hypothetical protein